MLGLLELLRYKVIVVVALRHRVINPAPLKGRILNMPVRVSLVVALLSRVIKPTLLMQLIHNITVKLSMVVAHLRVIMPNPLVEALHRVSMPVHLALLIPSIKRTRAILELVPHHRRCLDMEMDNMHLLIKVIPLEVARLSTCRVIMLSNMALAMVVIKLLHLPAHSALHRLCIIVTKVTLEMVINISVLIKPMVLDNILFLIKLPLACLRAAAQAIWTPSQPTILGSTITTNPHKLALIFLLMLNLTTIALLNQESLAMSPEERALQGSTKATSKEARERYNAPSADPLLHNTTMLAGSARRF